MGDDRDMVDAIAGKRAKHTVDYSVGLPNSHCGPIQKWPAGVCNHFIGPDGCTKVRGVIAPGMWCKLWEARDIQDG